MLRMCVFGSQNSLRINTNDLRIRVQLTRNNFENYLISCAVDGGY